MRSPIAAAILLAGIGSPPVWAAATTARPADAFVDSIGVNTHFGYRDTTGQPYFDYAGTKAILLELGVRHIRDGGDVYTGSPKLWLVDAYRNLYLDTGIKTTFIPTTSNNNTGPALITAINRITPAALDGVEGYNEPDNIAIGGLGNQAAIDWQKVMYDAIKGSTDSAIFNLPVSGPSPIFGYAPIAGLAPWMDYQNHHPYPGPEMPTRSLDANISEGDKVAGTGPKKPYIFTEWGYDHYNNPNKTNWRAAGIYTPRFIAEGFNRGVRLTHYYQLFVQGEAGHGLSFANMSADGRTITSVNRRPAYYAIQALISTLADPNATFKPGTLGYTLAGPTGKAEFYKGAKIHQTLLQKSNGDFYLLLWNDVTVYDSATDTDVANPAVPVTLKVNTPLSGVTLYEFGDDGLLTTSYPSYADGEIALNVKDRITIVRLDPTSTSVFASTGSVVIERWRDTAGTAIADIPLSTPPHDLERNTILEAYGNVMDNMGQRIRGHIVAPQTGPYRFWVAGDDAAELYLSRSDNPADKQKIASTTTATAPREWGKAASQKSHVVYLQANDRYYFEAVAKEGSASDHLAVAWNKPATAVNATFPDEVVPGSVITPYVGVTVTDDLADDARLHLKTPGWSRTTLADGARSTVDSAVLYKTDNAAAPALVWAVDDLETFTARAYDLSNASYDQAAFVQFSASPDGVAWTPIAVKSRRLGDTAGQVYNTVTIVYDLAPQAALPAGTNYLKYELKAGAGSASSFRLGQVRLTAASSRRVDAPARQSDSAGNLLVLEVEDYTQRASRSGRDWTMRRPTGYAGSGAMMVPGTNLVIDTPNTATAPRLDYNVEFAAAGTHYVWLRAAGASTADDSFHVGLNGVAQASSDRISGFGTALGWGRATTDGPVATLNVPSAGVHTLNLWMREDGAVVDRILLTTDSAYVPAAAGPAASPRSFRLAPVGDAFARGGSFAGTNYGRDVGLVVKDDNTTADYDRQSYTKFSLAAVPSAAVASATLRLNVASIGGISTSNPMNVRLYAVADDAWTEPKLTWNARPAAGSLLGTTTITAAGQSPSFDVTTEVNAALASDDAVSFALVAETPSATQIVTFGSRESGGGPTLDLVYP